MAGVSSTPLSDKQIDELLKAIQGRLHLSITCSSYLKPGETLTASIIPASTEIDASDLLNGVLNLGWAAKDILFNDGKVIAVPGTNDPSNDGTENNGDNILGALGNFITDPVQTVSTTTTHTTGPLPQVIGGVSTPVTDAKATATTDPTKNIITKNPVTGNPVITPVVGGVNGLAAQIFGTFSVPQLKIGIKYKWQIRHGSHVLSEGKNLIALNGLANPSVSLILPPVFRELRMDTLANPGGTLFCLWVTVTLFSGTRSLEYDLPTIPVVQLPFLIPTVVAMFSEPGFGVTDDSSVLLIVPEHSPLTSAESLFKELRKIESAVDTLRGIGNFATLILGMQTFLDTVPQEPRIRFAATNQINKLKDIILKPKPWYDFLGSDENFDDKTMSLIVLGCPGTTVLFFKNFNCNKNDSQGYFSIHLNTDADLSAISDFNSPLPDCFVAVRDLNSDGAVPPVTIPVGRSPEMKQDSDLDEEWSDGISSVKFDDNWIERVNGDIANPKSIVELLCKPIKKPTPVKDTREPGSRDRMGDNKGEE